MMLLAIMMLIMLVTVLVVVVMVISKISGGSYGRHIASTKAAISGLLAMAIAFTLAI